jgi:hypothetical protein
MSYVPISMAYASYIGSLAINHVTAYLHLKPQTSSVISVEKDKAYQSQGIDLLWNYVGRWDAHYTDTIEVKGDRWYNSGNYFFETVSNQERNTEGCFLYSKADYLYYYFLNKELHIIPLPAARQWFLSQIDSFPEKMTSTASASYSEEAKYHTVGRLVPRDLLRNAVQGVSVVRYKKNWANGTIAN